MSDGQSSIVFRNISIARTRHQQLLRQVRPTKCAHFVNEMSSLCVLMEKHTQTHVMLCAIKNLSSVKVFVQQQLIHLSQQRLSSWKTVTVLTACENMYQYAQQMAISFIIRALLFATEKMIFILACVHRKQNHVHIALESIFPCVDKDKVFTILAILIVWAFMFTQMDYVPKTPRRHFQSV